MEADIDANSITLAGQVKGDLTAAGDVTAPADNRLDGNISAQNVEVGGAVNGEIVAIGRVRLGPRARVDGDITSKVLAIAEGAVFIGTSVMEQEGRGAARPSGRPRGRQRHRPLGADTRGAPNLSRSVDSPTSTVLREPPLRRRTLGG